MQISDVIAFSALLVSVASLVVSWYVSNKTSRLSVFSEYTRRFQDIVLHLYSDPNNKEVYHKLYFDLCSEEYYLRKQLPRGIWNNWEQGMKRMMENEDIRASWEKQKFNYNMQEEFMMFFLEEITQSKTNK